MRKGPYIGLVIVFIAIAISLIFLSCNRQASPVPRAVQGSLHLEDWNLAEDGPIALNGEWRFYWNHLLSPEDFVRRTSMPKAEHIPKGKANFAFDLQKPQAPFGYLKAPSTWDNYEHQGQKIGALGYGTYVLKLQGLPKYSHKHLALRLKDALTAYKLYFVPERFTQDMGPSDQARQQDQSEKGLSVQDQRWDKRWLIMENGVVATSPDKGIPQHLPLLRELPHPKKTSYIIVQVSNYHDSIGGFTQPLELGIEKDLYNRREYNRSLSFAVIGILIIMALYHFGLFLHRREDKASLLFAMVNLLIAIRMPLTDKLIHEAFPQPNEFLFELFMKIEYATFYLALPVFYAFLRRAFPQEFPAIIEKILWITGYVFLLTLIFPQKIYGRFLPGYEIITILASLLMIFSLIQAARKRRLGALISLSGFVAIFLTIINDILHGHSLIHTGYTISYGLAAFVLAQSYILARQFASAYHTAEHLSDNLQQEVDQQTRDLSKKNKELLEANNTKDKFFSILAHDLRGPIGNLAILFNETAQKPSDISDNLFDKLKESTQRTYELLEDLLAWSRSQQGRLELKTENLAIQEIIDKAISVTKESAEHKGITTSAPQTSPFYVKADRSSVTTVLRNLLSNAVKFTHAAGKIYITTEQREDMVFVTIRDSGVGIGQNKLNKLFQIGEDNISSPGTNNELGSGLGLILCKEFIEANQGTIGAKSIEGQGSTFWFALPAGLKPEQKDAIIEQSPLQRLHKVLVVEDNFLNMQSTTTILERLQLKVEIALDGQKAVEQALSREIDVILMDIELPRLNGIDAARRILKEKSQVTIIALTSYDKEELDTGNDSLPFHYYLKKPLREDDFFAALRSVDKV